MPMLADRTTHRNYDYNLNPHLCICDLAHHTAPVMEHWLNLCLSREKKQWTRLLLP